MLIEHEVAAAVAEELVAWAILRINWRRRKCIHALLIFLQVLGCQVEHLLVVLLETDALLVQLADEQSPEVIFELRHASLTVQRIVSGWGILGVRLLARDVRHLELWQWWLSFGSNDGRSGATSRSLTLASLIGNL